MPAHLRLVHTAQEEWLRDFESAVSRIDLREPSTWLARESEIEEKMLRDADIAHAIDHRQSLIAGREYFIVPKREGQPQSELAVTVAEDMLEFLERFAESRKLLARAFFHGSTYANIVTQPKRLRIGDGVERIWHVAVDLEDRAKWLYRKTIDDPRGPNPKAVWKRRELYGPEAGEWKEMSDAETRNLVKHVYSDEMGGLGYGRGLREALGTIWYAKTHTHQETLAAIERFARGLPHLKVDGLRDANTGKPNATIVADSLKLLKRMMARHGLVTDSNDTLEVITGSMEGHAMLSDFRRELRDAVKTLVLSADLTTGGTEGGGSYALADVQEGSTEILVQFDRESLEESLTRGLLGCLWAKNHANMVELGIVDDRPKIDLKQERKEDPEVAVTTATGMHAIGAPLGLDDLYKRTGWKRPKEDEEVLAGAVAPQPFDLGPGSDAGTFAGVPLPGVDSVESATVVGQQQPQEDHQDTALNGAQVTAAAEIIIQVVEGKMPPVTAKLMLTSMFNLPPDQANRMVDEAVSFTPTPDPVPIAAPGAPPTPEPFGAGVT